ncbi:glycosyltransferase family 4 protein, partial [bacterium]|nr:glycosyltransferase family 4 protein [bacterium]
MDKIYIQMPVGNFYGWAICGKNVLTEMNEIADIAYVPLPKYNQCKRDYTTDSLVTKLTEKPNGEDFNYLQSIDNSRPQLHLRGKKNVGYMFYEATIMEDDFVDALKGYDIIATGSDWNSQVCRDHGIKNVVTIHQGIDLKLFRHQPKQFFGDKFVIFSGGKLEHRKAQDIVAYVVGKMQKKYPDVLLVTNWGNLFKSKESSQEDFNKIRDYLIPDQTIMTEIISQSELVKYIGESDIGFFPNRSEGGTNLVMMEYMACSKTVVANTARGQADVLDDEHAYCISGKTEDDLIDEAIEALEWAYINREAVKEKGFKARKAMEKFTWQKTAKEFVGLFNEN